MKLNEFLKTVVEEGKGLNSIESKVALALEMVEAKLGHTPYSGPQYEKLLSEYREKGKPVPLGENISRGLGVCREHSLLLNLSLRELGLKPRYTYVKVISALKGMEDHAFNIIRYKGKVYIIDSYSSLYNGLLLRDLHRGVLFPPQKQSAPWRKTTFRNSILPVKIVKRLSFPKVRTIPVPGKCLKVFE